MVTNYTTEEIAVAVLIPCHNEESTIAQVVKNFREALPQSRIYVCDNNSTDQTVDFARAAEALILSESLQGKGSVVRRLFADIDADVYVLVDGDDTYDASSAPKLVEKLLSENLDMVNSKRLTISKEAYRRGHKFGNWLLTTLVGLFFGKQFEDLLSGYKAFSRRFVKSFPVLSRGFEIETELTVHALELHMPVAEIEAPYKERPEGSTSKLKTYRDGLRILRIIAVLIKEERPLLFFSALFGGLTIMSLILAWPIFDFWLETGLVPRFPTAILATGIMLLAFLSLTCGLILDTVTRGRREMKYLHYLAQPWLRREAITGSRNVCLVNPSEIEVPPISRLGTASTNTRSRVNL